MKAPQKRILVVTLVILAVLLLIVGVKYWNASESANNNTAPAETVTFQEGTPTRVQNLLDGHKNKFNRIAHYYTWTRSPFTSQEAMGYVVWCGLIGLLCTAAIYNILLAKDVSILDKMGTSVLTVFLLGVSVISGMMGISEYEASKNPGCFCLTDKALAIIPPSGGTECVWIPYKDILYLQNYGTSASSLEEEIAILQSKNKIKYSLERMNEKQETDDQEIANLIKEVKKSGGTYDKENPSQLWIVFKENSKYRLNTYCCTKALESAQDYEDLCNYVKRKTRVRVVS